MNKKLKKALLYIAWLGPCMIGGWLIGNIANDGQELIMGFIAMNLIIFGCFVGYTFVRLDE